ncbi:MAG TPA: tetratricopeptide repeat protein [Thermoanaerobaculaceae bacterium]|nr:tetratricopeptide repeat protein [Thermoanaerobaculaceae bacterium]
MKRLQAVLVGAAFLGGVAVGIASSVAKSNASLFTGKAPKDAALALLGVAQSQAENGSWENLAVGRAYYLMGDRAGGQAIFDRVMAGKVKESDWMRLGRIYVEGKEWDKAQAAFDKALSLDPKDAEKLAEIGAYYNLHGNRAKAEELFTRSFQLKPDQVWNTLNVAGSYVGIKPQ